MKYYKVDFHSDELNRIGKKGFYPFVAELVEKYEDYSYLLKEGNFIDSWDKNISLHSCQDGKPDDRLANDSGWYIFSDKVIDTFNKNSIKGFQYLPVNIFKMDGSRLEGYNFVANIFNKVSCLDMEKSKYSLFGDERPNMKGKIKILDKIILDKNKLENDLDIFRIEEKATRIIASERLAALYQENKFTNLAFEEVEVI